MMVDEIYKAIFQNTEEYTIKFNDFYSYNVLGSYIEVQKKRIFLTRMESNLLLFFCLNPNKIILAEKILDYFSMRSHCCYTAQNVYVIINKLRSKIEKKKSKPVIIKNMRPGYIFNVNSIVISKMERDSR